jgi:multidrug efflux pump subunit AcrB
VIVAFGVLKGGRLAFTFMPKIEGDIVMTTVELPFGSPVEETRAALERVQSGARRVLAKLDGGSEGNLRGMFAQIGASVAGSGPMADASGGGSHVAQMTVQLRPLGERSVTAREFAGLLRQEVGEMPGVERFAVTFNIGPSAGADVGIELSHSNTETLNAAAKAVAEELSGFAGVQDINDGFQEGKPQLDMKLKEAARALGITQRDLARQLRSAFFGAEAVRQQRGRDEVRTYVRLPLEERQSLFHLDRFLLRTPQGGEIPLGQAASISEGVSHTLISREDGRRVVTVTADVNAEVTNASNVSATFINENLPALAQDFPGLSYRLSGAEEERKESMSSLGTGMIMALFAMYAMMAVAFRSYTQPLLVMAAIPLGVVGAFGGHLLMGFDLSLISMLGIVALAGVVVNDNLVLLDAINANRKLGMPVYEAVVQGSVRRLRPVLLTSLTTFLGLAPMIFETSVQARFLVPMTISLGYGVLFVTVITILIVPCLYLMGASLLKRE